MRLYYEGDGVRLFQGDCRDVELGGETVDLLLTDPPYGRQFAGLGVTTQKANIRADGVRQGMRVVRQMLAATDAAWAPDLHLLLFCHWQSWPDFYDAVSSYAEVRNALIWWKDRGGMGDCALEYAPDYEVILYGVRGRRALLGKRPGAVLPGFPPLGHQRSHPTEKPVGLLRALVARHAPAGGLVLDPFAGVGSTLVAARAEGRRAIGVEIEERYCRVAVERLQQGRLGFEAGSEGAPRPGAAAAP